MPTIASALSPGRTWLGSLLREELAPRPGRLAGALRTAACCCVVVTVGMIFEIPLLAYAAYIVLLITGEDVVATFLVGLAGILAATLALGTSLFLYSFDAGEPALRLPLIAIVTAAGLYASRALKKAGPVAFLGAFVLVMSQTIVDLFATTEVLVHLLCWLWVVVALPVAVTLVVHLVTGERPNARARRSALAVLRGLADALRHPGAGSVRERHADAVDLVESSRRAAMADATAKRRLDSDARLIEILATLLAMQEVLPVETPAALRAPLADACDACADVFERADATPPLLEPLADDLFDEAPPGARPVVRALAAGVTRLRDGLERRRLGIADRKPDAIRRPATSRRDRLDDLHFALKTALAVMLAYLIYTGLGWPEISTAITTCFFVSLGSLGESIHKFTLRITGALLGGVAAGLCIAFVLPSMTNIGHLCLLVGAATVISAWVAASSPRLSYMGLQIAFAFFLGIFQGYAPPAEFTVLRDRVLGILLGNVLVTVIFSTLWPTSAKARAETLTEQALEELAAFAGAGMPRDGGLRLAVLGSIEEARRLSSIAALELRMIPPGASAGPPRRPVSVPAVERLAGFVFVAAESRGPAPPADRLRRDDELVAELIRTLAHPPPSGRAAPARGVGAVAADGVVEGPMLTDRIASEANALLLSELEKAHGIAA